MKPNRADRGFGTTKDAAVHCPNDAKDYLSRLRGTVSDCDILIQEYLPGPEYGVGLIGNPESTVEALPVLEAALVRQGIGRAPIPSHQREALFPSPNRRDIAIRPAVLDAEVRARLVGWSKLLFARFGLRDYGRFDFRADRHGRIKLINVSANPACGSEGRLAKMAGFAGLSHRDLLGRIIRAAIDRAGCPRIQED
jgi:D-alanine-D-alanine ligase